MDIQYFQSNHEGALIDYLQEHGYGDGGIVVNAVPKAYFGDGYR
ncbi:MAG: type II 3-dehydroquinate dehydratase [Saprospiraceae bacterium]|nr:type II 3-dehydroquinate dehydratase [Saprospiraceae bacterium]